MKAEALLGNIVVMAVIGLFSLSAATAHTFAQGDSESSTQTDMVSQSRPKAPVFQHLTIDDGLSDNSVYHLLQDRLGFIWATTVQGINKYDGMTFTTFMPQAPGSGQSTPQLYRNMLEDRDGILWFYNYGAGLVRHDPVLDTWAFYQHEEENPNSLAHNTTWFVFQDRDGILWVSTFGGLSRFDPATEQFTNYHHDPENTASGELFIGGAKGFNSFFPDQLPDKPTPPPVVLTTFELLDKPVAVGGDSPLQKHINVTNRITLPYDYTALTLKFAALNYRSPQKNQYAYILEGFEQDWISTDSRHRFATYTNLGPGKYRFRVKASNNDGVWNEEGIALTLTVNPLWWKSRWFRSLAGLTIVPGHCRVLLSHGGSAPENRGT